MSRPVEKVLRCECGFEVRASEDMELVARVQRHARDAHRMEFTAEQVLVLAFRAQLEAESVTAQIQRGERQRREEEE